MKKYIRSSDDSSYDELLEQLSDQVYEVWQSYGLDGLDSSEILDIVLEHMEYIAESWKDFLDAPFPKNWRTIVKRKFDEEYNNYSWE